MTAHLYKPDNNMKDSVPLIFLDLETTGLQPDRHVPWEAAWVTAHHRRDINVLVVESKFEASIPLSFRELENADQEALRIGRWEERKAHNLMEKEAVIAKLKKDCADVQKWSEAKLHLVGANPTFDHSMLCCNWIGWPGFGEGLWHHHLICVVEMMALHNLVPPPWSSNDLTMFAVERDETKKHTAMGDAEWAMQVYAWFYGLDIV